MTQTLDPATRAAEWSEWRAANERRRQDPYGYLAYRAVHFLEPEPRTFPGVPGVWRTGPDGPVVELGAGESLLVDGTERTGGHAFGPVREREFRWAAQAGDVVLELSRRGGRDLLRPLDPTYRLRADYVETPAFEYDPAWVLPAVFERYPQGRPQQVRAAVEGIEHTHEAVGEVVFTVDGSEHRLVVFGRDDDPGLGILLFRDATSGVTTYAASRSVALPLPAEGETALVLDFNRAGNLQCAYTDHAPCPLAPPRNHLPFAVEAGEQTPVLRGGREAVR
ncbi:DUF1684 domain-containing protein [Pseudonocardia pini]|uniref:DUF1684 domain-containing protein n=1 Tax=Pseudonocardia pini TaxID=2758030 RepID=UPI0015F0F481|nr:DUF1684 domain-containing protein [Pseudonocardia pini]